ncbi:MAG TPA: hypothetical protein VII40_07425 [Xanthobacteraceae bacterium]
MQSNMQRLAYDWAPGERGFARHSLLMIFGFYAAVIAGFVALASTMPQPSAGKADANTAADRAAAERWQGQCYRCGIRPVVVRSAWRDGGGGEQHAEISSR